MNALPRTTFLAVATLSLLLLAACQVPLPSYPSVLLESQGLLTTNNSDGDQVETEAEETSAQADETPVPAEETETADADTAVGGATSADAGTTAATDTGDADALVDEPADALTVTGDDTQPSVTVVTRSLRIRSGPGAEHETLGGAQAGETFPILGGTADCIWLNVEHPTLGSVWLSGLAEYAAMSIACEQLTQALSDTNAGAAAEMPTATPVPAPEASEPTPAPAAEPTQATDQGAASEAAPETAQETADALPADQGCYLIQNQLGPELNITITAQERDWSDNFQVGESQELLYCLVPGRYTVTVAAPPPWDDLNDALTVQAGDRYFWPIRPNE